MTRKPRITFDGHQVLIDMVIAGWNMSDLATHAKMSPMTVMRFVRGQHQTARTAYLLAKALGHSVERYLITHKKPARKPLAR